MRSSLLGDAGLIVFREGRVLYRSKEQQHFFNSPMQIGLNAGAPLSDLPEHSVLAEMQLRHFDLVVAATDGLFDNLHDEEILLICSEALKDMADVSSAELETALASLAARLLKAARVIGQDASAFSPFCLNAISQGFFFIGGYGTADYQKVG